MVIKRCESFEEKAYYIYVKKFPSVAEGIVYIDTEVDKQKLLSENKKYSLIVKNTVDVEEPLYTFDHWEWDNVNDNVSTSMEHEYTQTNAPTRNEAFTAVFKRKEEEEEEEPSKPQPEEEEYTLMVEGNPSECNNGTYVWMEDEDKTNVGSTHTGPSGPIFKLCAKDNDEYTFSYWSNQVIGEDAVNMVGKGSVDNANGIHYLYKENGDENKNWKYIATFIRNEEEEPEPEPEEYITHVDGNPSNFDTNEYVWIEYNGDVNNPYDEYIGAKNISLKVYAKETDGTDGYYFNGWTKIEKDNPTAISESKGVGTFDSAKNAYYLTVSNGENDKNWIYTAHYQTQPTYYAKVIGINPSEIGIIGIDAYLEKGSSGNFITANSSNGKYQELVGYDGFKYKLQHIEIEGYTFLKWEDEEGNVITEEGLEITMNAKNKEYTAFYEVKEQPTTKWHGYITLVMDLGKEGDGAWSDPIDGGYNPGIFLNNTNVTFKGWGDEGSTQCVANNSTRQVKSAKQYVEIEPNGKINLSLTLSSGGNAGTLLGTVTPSSICSAFDNIGWFGEYAEQTVNSSVDVYEDNFDLVFTLKLSNTQQKYNIHIRLNIYIEDSETDIAYYYVAIYTKNASIMLKQVSERPYKNNVTVDLELEADELIPSFYNDYNLYIRLSGLLYQINSERIDKEDIKFKKSTYDLVGCTVYEERGSDGQPTTGGNYYIQLMVNDYNSSAQIDTTWYVKSGGGTGEDEDVDDNLCTVTVSIEGSKYLNSSSVTVGTSDTKHYYNDGIFTFTVPRGTYIIWRAVLDDVYEYTHRLSATSNGTATVNKDYFITISVIEIGDDDGWGVQAQISWSETWAIRGKDVVIALYLNENFAYQGINPDAEVVLSSTEQTVIRYAYVIEAEYPKKLERCWVRFMVPEDNINALREINLYEYGTHLMRNKDAIWFGDTIERT